MLAFCFFVVYIRICRWVLSSAGRASRLHREGREFEPLSAHQHEATER